MANSNAVDGITFSIMNEDVLKRLQKDGKVELPQKKISVSKDRQWNEKFIHAQMLQGIINGESVQSIASRILPEINSKTDFKGKSANEVDDLLRRNEASAIRNARTMYTCAENKGRLDSFKEMEKKGVVMKKVWRATPDDRTRKSHIDIDGEEQDLDNLFSNGCMFPGDGNGPSEEVWNCRCSMGRYFIGFRRKDGSISKINYEKDRTMHDDQMKAYKRQAVASKKNAVKNEEYLKLGKYVDVEKALPAELAKMFANEVKKNADKYGMTYAEYWDAVQNGKIKNSNIDDILKKAKDSSKTNGASKIVSEDMKKEGLELYAKFIKGGSGDIHELAGYNEMKFGEYDPKKANEEKLKALDTVFTPAKEEKVVYKGTPMTEDQINAMSGKEIVVHSYSSTSKDLYVAQDYAHKADDYEEFYPVYANIKIEKDVPIADTLEVLGGGGMRNYEQEITIGRETVWEYSKFKKHGDDDEAYYTVDVIVRKKR